MNPSFCPTPIIVLDTNVVLDWLLFQNAECAAIEAHVVSGRIRWHATAAMRDELTHVLARGGLKAWKPDASALLARWDQHCFDAQPPVPSIRPRGCDVAIQMTKSSSTSRSLAVPLGSSAVIAPF